MRLIFSSQILCDSDKMGGTLDSHQLLEVPCTKINQVYVHVCGRYYLGYVGCISLFILDFSILHELR
jgi:hypothetical protein